jgi:hypothetical protein
MRGKLVRKLVPRVVSVALAALCAAIAVPTQGQTAFYLGAWRLTSAVIAPWADPKSPPDVAEKTRLIGQTVTLAPAAITGPKVLACKGPHYKLSDFTADMLFQGAFEEMRDNDKSLDPLKLAASLGSRNRLRDRLALRRPGDGRDRSRRLRLHAQEAVAAVRRAPH